MEKRLSYMIVGTFVILITLSLLSFLFWLTKYGNKSIEYDYYKTYFKESVSGLNVESLVKLRGVEVGRVKKIKINQNNSEEVQVSLEIIKDTPIKEDTFTVLDSQGITGLKYIELKGGSNESPRLETNKEDISTIPSRKSVMSNLFDSSESITDKAEIVLGRVDVVLRRMEIILEDQNIKNLSNTLTKLSSTMNYVDQNKEKIGDLLIQMDTFLVNTQKMEDEMLPSIAKLGTMSDKAANASDSMVSFFNGMELERKKGEFSVGTIIEENLEVLNEAAVSLRDLSRKLENTVDILKDSPSDILYKSNEKILGPGESHD